MPKRDYTTKLQAQVDQFVNRWIRVGRSGREKAEAELYQLIDNSRRAQISTVDGYESLVDAVVQENKPLEHRTASASIVLKVTGDGPEDPPTGVDDPEYPEFEAWNALDRVVTDGDNIDVDSRTVK